MAHKSIREYDSKKILASCLPKYLPDYSVSDQPMVKITAESNLDAVLRNNHWLSDTALVVKVDQLVKRRMKNGLVKLNVNWAEASQWIAERMNKEVTVDGITGITNTFLVEPYRKHDNKNEYYCAIRTRRDGDEILFFDQGGIDVGEVEGKAAKIFIGIGKNIDDCPLEQDLLSALKSPEKELIAKYLRGLYKLFVAADFVFLEINPLVVIDQKVLALDLAVRVDDTASQSARELWGPLAFPPSFGRAVSEEEEYIRSLDENSGASLKLTILRPEGRVWTLLAGGGASVVFTDTIADLGFGDELANYGEYSGNPTDEETYEYARTVLDLMTRTKDKQNRGKVLIIGGGIANFTDVAKTFGGISRALKEYRTKLKNVGAKIYVRRGGPNYKEGIRNLKMLAPELGVPFEVYGPETHMTRIVKLALNRS